MKQFIALSILGFLGSPSSAHAFSVLCQHNLTNEFGMYDCADGVRFTPYVEVRDGENIPRTPGWILVTCQAEPGDREYLYRINEMPIPTLPALPMTVVSVNRYKSRTTTNTCILYQMFLGVPMVTQRLDIPVFTIDAP